MKGSQIVSWRIPGFDDGARDLIRRMLDAGWTGRVSSKGHAILRAPDGKSTASVARDFTRARSGRNATADFERWLARNRR